MDRVPLLEQPDAFVGVIVQMKWIGRRQVQKTERPGPGTGIGRWPYSYRLDGPGVFVFC